MSEPISSYYNTTHVRGLDRLRYELAASGQEMKIVELFVARRRPMAPSEVLAAGNFAAPITSIRRAMTTLTKRNVLVKTEQQIRGPYGRPEYRWRLREPDPEQGSLPL